MIALAIVAVFAFLATPASAGILKGDVVKGPIIAVDVVKGELTVDDVRSGERVTYKVGQDVAASLSGRPGKALLLGAFEFGDEVLDRLLGVAE